MCRCDSCQDTGIGDPHVQSACPDCSTRRAPREIDGPAESASLSFDDAGYPRLPKGWDKLPQPLKDSLWEQYCRLSASEDKNRDRQHAVRVAAAKARGEAPPISWRLMEE